MGKDKGKREPQAAAKPLGRVSRSRTYPDDIILPQNVSNCQVITVCELTLIDDVLRRYNVARARWLAGGGDQDYLTAQALADDRRALLAEIGGES